MRWYDRSHRSLPWRDDPRPYRVWVGEVMSQQTNLAVAVPRFEAFVERLPDVAALARCSDETLERLWAGLGYYARARHLVRGARIVVDELDGRLPRTYEGWLRIPGCGPYTAAMLASVCHGERVPAVDGNVIRVWSRLNAVTGDPRRGAVQRAMRDDLARRVRRVRRPGDLNQALMELGQRICTRARPACERCPVRASCAARERGTVHLCPPPRPRLPVRAVELDVVVALDLRETRLLVGLRTGGFLAGTVGFALLDPGESAVRRLDEARGVSVETLDGGFRHVITHHRIRGRVSVLRTLGTSGRASARRLGGLLGLTAARWIDRSSAVERLGTSLDRKALHLYRSTAGTRPSGSS